MLAAVEGISFPSARLPSEMGVCDRLRLYLMIEVVMLRCLHVPMQPNVPGRGFLERGLQFMKIDNLFRITRGDVELSRCFRGITKGYQSKRVVH